MRIEMPKDKVIAYFVRAKNGPSHANNNRDQAHNNVGPEGRKILVDVGDRCVAPAKSRPKKRKTLTGKDGSGGSDDADAVNIELSQMGTDALGIVWSDGFYSVRHLVKEFEGHFPVIVKVDQGHYREGVVDLARGQVLLVSTYGRQRRVFVKNSSNAFLSLPLDYQMQVCIDSIQESLSFSDALSKGSLPFSATVVSVDPSADTTYGNITGEQLTVVAIKDTVFLLANAIIQGWADQSEIMVIPDLLQVEFAVAQGLVGGSDGEWRDYHGMFSRSVRHLDFESVLGYRGILREGPGGNELRTSTFRPSTEDDQSDVETKNVRQRIAYENVPLANTNETKDQTAEPEEASFSDNNDDPNDDRQKDRSVDQNLHPPELILFCSAGTLDCKRPREGDPDPQLPSDTDDQVTLDEGRMDEGLMKQKDSRKQSPVNSGMETDRIDSEINNLIDRSSSTANDQARDDDLCRFETRNELGRENFADNPLNTTSVKFLYDERLLTNDHRSEKNPEMNVSSSARSANWNIIGDGQHGTEGGGTELYNSNSIEVNLRVERDSVTTEDINGTPEPMATSLLSPSPLPSSSQSSGGVLELANRFNAAILQFQASEKKTTEASPQPKIKSSPLTPQTNSDRTTVCEKNNSNGPFSKNLAENSAAQKFNKSINRKPTQTNVSSTPNSNGSEQAFVHRSSKPIPPSAMPCTANRASQYHSGVSRPASAALAGAAKPTIGPSPPSSKATASVTRDITINSSADVPTDLESLSVASVVGCLQILDLGKYSLEFDRCGIDGRRLTDMTEKILERQFHFSPLEASKVMRFVRGWRP